MSLVRWFREGVAETPLWQHRWIYTGLVIVILVPAEMLILVVTR